MNGHALSVALAAIASDEVSADVDLWPRVSARARLQRVPRTKVRPARRRVLAAAALVLLVALAAAGPGALTAADELFGHFGLVLVNPIDVLIPHPPAPGARAEGGSVQTPRLTLEEARRAAPFTIKVPAWLPDGMAFRGALVDDRSTTVVLSYRGVDSATGLFIQASPNWSGGYVVPSWVTRQLRVHGHPALYARGGWGASGTWDGSVSGGYLSWQDEDGLTYVLSFSGLGLSADDLVRIAESMR